MDEITAVKGENALKNVLELERITDLLDRAGNGDAWHGAPIDAIVSGIPARQAAARPLAEAHTIWEIVLHIAVWDRIVARRLAGETVDPTPAEDWPLMPSASEEQWSRAIADLRQARAELRDALLAFDGRRLGETVQGKSYSFYVMAHGIVQHDLYHAGQIAVLRKAHS